MHKWIQYPKKVHLDCADSEIPQFKLAAPRNPCWFLRKSIGKYVWKMSKTLNSYTMLLI